MTVENPNPFRRMLPRRVDSDMPDEADDVLAEARRSVDTNRNAYGSPTDNFARIAAFWTVIFGVPVTERQVGLAMIALKVARDIAQPKRDNLVDIPGYAYCLDLLTPVEGSIMENATQAQAVHVQSNQQPGGGV